MNVMIDKEIIDEYKNIVKLEHSLKYIFYLNYTFFYFCVNNILNKKAFEKENSIIKILKSFIDETAYKGLKYLKIGDLYDITENLFLLIFDNLPNNENKNQILTIILKNLKEKIKINDVEIIDRILKRIDDIIANLDFYYQEALKKKLGYYLSDNYYKSIIRLMFYNLDINNELQYNIIDIISTKSEEAKLFILNFLIVLKAIINEFKGIKINNNIFIGKLFEIKKYYFKAKNNFNFLLKERLKDIAMNEKSKKSQKKNAIDIREDIKILKEYNYMDEDTYSALEELIKNYLSKKELDVFENLSLHFIVDYINWEYLKDDYYNRIKYELELFDKAFKILDENNVFKNALRYKMLNNKFLRYYVMASIFYARAIKFKLKLLDAIDILKMRQILRNNNFKIPYEYDSEYEEFLKDIETIFINQFTYKAKFKTNIAEIFKYNITTSKYYDNIKELIEKFDDNVLKSRASFKAIIKDICDTIRFLENNNSNTNTNIFIDNIYKKYALQS